MRMLCCPFRLPDNASSRLAGGTLKSSMVELRFSILSLRKAICWMLVGSFFENRRAKIFSVSLHLKLSIIAEPRYNAYRYRSRGFVVFLSSTPDTKMVCLMVLCTAIRPYFFTGKFFTTKIGSSRSFFPGGCFVLFLPSWLIYACGCAPKARERPRLCGAAMPRLAFCGAFVAGIPPTPIVLFVCL